MTDKAPAAPDKEYLHSGSITKAVLGWWKIDLKTLAGRQRHQSISAARVLWGYLLRQRTLMSYQEIGRLMGNRDHSTAMYYVEKCRRDIGYNPAVRATLESVESLAEKIDQERKAQQLHGATKTEQSGTPTR